MNRIHDIYRPAEERTALVPDPARNIYCVGDCASGASLVVRALASGKSLEI